MSSLLMDRALPRAAGVKTSRYKLCRLPMTTPHELAHSEEELRMILTASQESGVLRQSELDLVEHVFVFADKRARWSVTGGSGDGGAP